LIDQLNGVLLSVRDKAYANEFALTKFNNRIAEPANVELSEPELHPLAGQEAEYILYGMGSCVLNQGAAFSEMLLLRISIRTTEALLEPDRAIVAAASPWLVFLWALAEGAVEAVEDMKRLVAGSEVELSSRLPGQ